MLLSVAGVQLDFARLEHHTLANAVQKAMQILAKPGALENMAEVQKMVAALQSLATLHLVLIQRTHAFPDTPQARPAADPYDLAALAEIAERLRDVEPPTETE